MENLISIVVPSFNAEIYINNTAKSVFKQTFSNWECIFVNDGSTDNTKEICLKWLEKDERFKYIEQENQGLSATRNSGKKIAKGNLIYFLDADDVLPSNALTDLLSNLNDDSDFCVGLTSMFDLATSNHLGTLHHFQKQVPFLDNSNKEILVQIVNEGHSCIAMNNLYRKSFLDKHQLTFQEGILHEDELWFFETIFFANKISFCWKSTYHYHVNNTNSITNNRGDKNILDTLKILEVLYAKYYLNPSYIKHQELIGLYITHFKHTIFEALNIAIKNVSTNVIVAVEDAFKNIHVNRNNVLLDKHREKYYFNFVLISLLGIKKLNKYYYKLNKNDGKDNFKIKLLKWKAYLKNYKLINTYYKKIREYAT